MYPPLFFFHPSKSELMETIKKKEEQCCTSIAVQLSKDAQCLCLTLSTRCFFHQLYLALKVNTKYERSAQRAALQIKTGYFVNI